MNHATGRRATLLGCFALLLWSSLAVLTTATAGLPPFEVLALSFGVAGILGCSVLLLRARESVRVLRATPVSAWLLTIAALSGYHALYFIALKHAPALEANLVNYLWPLLIVVFAALIGGSRVRALHWVGTVMGLIAALLVLTRGQSIAIDPAHAPGFAAALGAALTWSLYSVLNRRHADVGSESMAVVCAIVGVLGALAHLAFETWVMPDARQWLVLFAMGAGPVGLAFWLWDRGTKHGDIALLGTLAYATPLMSTALILLAGKAQAHWTQAVACVLLVAGAWLSAQASRAPG